MLCSHKMAWRSAAVEPYLDGRYPEIECMSIFIASTVSVDAERVMNDTQSLRGAYVDSCFFKMFSFRLIEGNPNTVLDAGDDVVISQKMVNTFYQGKNPVGQTVKINGHLYRINGIMENIKRSVLPPVDILFTKRAAEMAGIPLHDFGCSQGLVFIKQRKGTHLITKLPEMQRYFAQIDPQRYQGKDAAKALLLPIEKVHFYKFERPLSGDYNVGNKSLLALITFFSFIVLVFALTNYINLMVAQTGKRAREMATRRLLGASRLSIVLRYIKEAMLLTALSMALGFLLVYFLEPHVPELLNMELRPLEEITLNDVLYDGAIFLITGFAAGLIPAWIISKYNPIDVVRGTFAIHHKMVLGKIFIVLQNVLSIAMIAFALVIYSQTCEMIHHRSGYETDKLMWVYLGNHNKAATLHEMAALPFVESVGTFSNNLPTSGLSNFLVKSRGNEYWIAQIEGDSVLMRELGLKVLRQNAPITQGGIWLTESSVKRLGIANNATSLHDEESNSDYTICGVISDFTIGTVKDADKLDGMLMCFTQDTLQTGALLKVKDEMPENIEKVGRVLTSVSGQDWNGRAGYLKEQISKQFQDEYRLQRVVLFVTLISVIISALGMLAMSLFFTGQRKLEIAVRKVFGSTGSGVVKWLLKSFVFLWAIAAIIAIPVAWLLTRQWLEGYAVRISYAGALCLAAAVIALMVIIFSILWQSMKAANEDPIENLRRQ